MDAETEGRTAAERFRGQHHLGVQPLGDLVEVIERATGIDVAVLDAGPDEHGLTMRDPDRDIAFIGVARSRKPMRQRSTLAHELAHVLFRDWVPGDLSNWSDQTVEEVRCQAFARHLLAPLEGVQQFLGLQESADLATLSTVVQHFLVSPAIAIVALEQAGYIDAATREQWDGIYTPQLAARFGWSDQYHALQEASDRCRAPQRLLARAITGYVNGVLSAQHIATLRGVPLDQVEAELREANIAPAELPDAWTAASDLPDIDLDLSDLDDDSDVQEGGQEATASRPG